MAWRAARSLLVLQQQLQAGAPRARPPATRADEWGLIGDAAHDPTSDHTPHNFPGWGNQLVTAADFPDRPDLGLDAHQILDDIRRSHDGRVKYGISHGLMFSSYDVPGHPAWTWRPYGGSDGHFTHGHLSVVGNVRADSTVPWVIFQPATTSHHDNQEDDDMGASFGPITIEREGFTSLTIPPVGQGAADPREAWLNLCNDTGDQGYALRVWYTTGNGAYAPLPSWGDSAGVRNTASGVRVSVQLPAGTAGLTILREPLPSGTYAGHLTCCIERGPVVKP